MKRDEMNHRAVMQDAVINEARRILSEALAHLPADTPVFAEAAKFVREHPHKDIIT